MKFRAFMLCSSIALVALSPVAQAKLSAPEVKMVATVDAEYERSIALLEKLVNQNSGTMNFPGVKNVGDMMRAELEPLGFKVEWIDMAKAGRSGHLVATKMGKKGTKKLLLIAHLDTVFEADSPFQTFVRNGDKAVGPGAGDDKGGMVVIVSALRAMQAAGTLKNANIEIHMTGDEEDAGEPIDVTRAPLIAAGKTADVALDFEGLSIDNGKDMGVISRRSSNSWKLEVSTASRSSRLAILLVAWRDTASGNCSAAMPLPLSRIRIRRTPPSSRSISTRVAPASIAFSTSSLTTDAGRSTTSPAAI